MTGILLLDKAPGISSQRAVHEVQRLCGAAKAGHGGTLDPMAGGLLPILLGSATKLSRFLLEGDKGYRAELLLGQVTDSYDTTGRVLERRPVAVTAEAFEQALAAFRGEILQVPPMYSALSVDGERLYKLARRGEQVERAARPVTIHRLELLLLEGERAVIEVDCSKGTYIRSLIHDLGAALGCGACMSGLTRTMAAGFSLAQAHTVEALTQAAAQGALPDLLIRPEALFAQLPALSPAPFFCKLLRDGLRVLQRKLGSDIAAGGMARLYVDGEFFGLLGEGPADEGSALFLIWRA
ncbi:MAG: tRNA pseudouridine(55) synthase TruB [Clostridiales bacterium]|nr:tRNA pseudouridine(55) synthase TruB [Clostridiales bacterium]